VFAAFDEPSAALEAALGTQRAVAAYRWEDGIELRVRIGIHAGHAALEDGDYVGLDVHRAARISQAGHGGQVLVSDPTHAALADTVELKDLGEYSLHGLEEPERLFQVVAPGLAEKFPPLRIEPKAADRMRVVLADDSVLLREGIARLLEDAGFEVVGQAGNADELMLKVRSYKPDVAIVDIRMPPTHTDEGLLAAREIREKHPGTGVLVLSQYIEAGYALDLLADSAEGVGYLLKDRVSDVKEFAGAVRRVGDGGSALDPTVVSQLVGRRRKDDPLGELTPRELEVLELVAEGRSNQAIAEQLFITLRAVEKHVTSIFQKLRLPADAADHRRVLAALTYLRS
jgi:DNA-binding NarL/FixJ family response regulator